MPCCLVEALACWASIACSDAIAEFDSRFQHIPKFTGLRIFKSGVSNCAKYTAGEWIDMLKVWVMVVPGMFPAELNITSLCHNV